MKFSTVSFFFCVGLWFLLRQNQDHGVALGAALTTYWGLFLIHTTIQAIKEPPQELVTKKELQEQKRKIQELERVSDRLEAQVRWLRTTRPSRDAVEAEFNLALVDDDIAEAAEPVEVLNDSQINLDDEIAEATEADYAESFFSSDEVEECEVVDDMDLEGFQDDKATPWEPKKPWDKGWFLGKGI